MARMKVWNAATSQWEYLAPGFAGPTGATGPAGVTGATGPVGATGPTGLGSNSTVFKEAPAGAKDGVNTSFTTTYPYIGGTLVAFRNGLGEGFMVTESNPSTGSFSMDAAVSTDDLWVMYQRSLTTSGNADTVDGYHANPTPAANNIPVLDSNSLLPTSTLGAAWIPYTPTFSNLTVGNGTLNCAYHRVGKTVFYRIRFTLGSTSAIGTDPRYSLPFPSINYGAQYSYMLSSTVALYDNSPLGLRSGRSLWMNTTQGGIDVLIVSGSQIAGSNLTATVPHTWAVNDVIDIEGSYEAA